MEAGILMLCLSSRMPVPSFSVAGASNFVPSLGSILDELVGPRIITRVLKSGIRRQKSQCQRDGA